MNPKTNISRGRPGTTALSGFAGRTWLVLLTLFVVVVIIEFTSEYLRGKLS